MRRIGPGERFLDFGHFPPHPCPPPPGERELTTCFRQPFSLQKERIIDLDGCFHRGTHIIETIYRKFHPPNQEFAFRIKAYGILARSMWTLIYVVIILTER